MIVPTKILPVANTAIQAMEVSQPMSDQYSAHEGTIDLSPVI